MILNKVPMDQNKTLDYIVDSRVRILDIGYINDYTGGGTKTFYQCCKEKVAALTSGNTNVQVNFGVTANNAPSDLPSNTVEWQYSWGYCRFRAGITSTNTGIAIVVLYGYSADGIAIKKIINDADQGWRIIRGT